MTCHITVQFSLILSILKAKSNFTIRVENKQVNLQSNYLSIADISLRIILIILTIVTRLSVSINLKVTASHQFLPTFLLCLPLVRSHSRQTAINNLANFSCTSIQNTKPGGSEPIRN